MRWVRCIISNPTSLLSIDVPFSVVEGKSRRKRTKGAPGVFQYAETVEDTVWNSEQAQKEIQV